VSVDKQLNLKGVTSCPLGEVRPPSGGPWGIKWMKDHFTDEADIIFSTSKKRSPKNISNAEDCNGKIFVSKKKKIGGALHHSVLSLKKVARLPSKDQNNILKILRKNV
jgi:hypothetical protein